MEDHSMVLLEEYWRLSYLHKEYKERIKKAPNDEMLTLQYGQILKRIEADRLHVLGLLKEAGFYRQKAAQ